MTSLDRSIFRERALEKYMRRQELHVILRLVSPPMFLFLWTLLLLSLCAVGLVCSIQMPVMVQGKGVVVQRKTGSANNGQEIVVLLLFPPDQQASLKIGQPATISVLSTNIVFHTTIESIEPGIMSPAAISTQINLQLPLTPTISGPAVVALARVQPMAQASAYLGSQCEVQVQVGTESVLSMLPGLSGVHPPVSISTITRTYHDLLQQIDSLKQKIMH